jgi:hypothetical protein
VLLSRACLEPADLFSYTLFNIYSLAKGVSTVPACVESDITQSIYHYGKDKVNGMIAAWVFQVSFKPLPLMASITPERFTHDLIKESGYFAINTLDEDPQNYAATFGFRSGRKTGKFQGITFSDAPNGSPILDGALHLLNIKSLTPFPQAIIPFSSGMSSKQNC